MWHRFWKCERSWWGSKQNGCLCRSNRPKGFLKKYEKFRRIHKKTSVPESLFGIFFVNFSEICVKTYFAEQHRTTASDYSSINSSEVLANETVNYDTTEAYVLIWARSVRFFKKGSPGKRTSSEAVVCRPQIRCS